MTTVQSWLAVGVNVTLLVGAGYAGTLWLRRWIRAQVVNPLNTVHTEITPNDGKTIADAVRRVETKVDTIGQRLEDHLHYHGWGQ